MNRSCGLLITLAVTLGVVVGCGEEERAAEAPAPSGAVQTTIEQVLRDPESWDQRTVIVRGEAHPRDGGFVLANEGSTIWVAAPSGVDAIEPGDRVAVRAEVERLTEEDADQVVEALRSPTEPGLPRPDTDAVKQTPAEVGEPFLVFRALSSAEQGAQGRAAAERPYEMAYVHQRLESAGLLLVRTGLGAELPEETDEPTLAARRYEVPPSSREFELLVFPSAASARRAAEDLRETDYVRGGGDLAVAANIVAAFPSPSDEFRGYKRIRDVLRDLG